MNREIALAYGIAGLSAAIAVIAVIGSTVGFFEEEPVIPAPTTEIAAPAVPTPEVAAPARTAPEVAAKEPAPDVQYVDEQGRPVDPPSVNSRRRGREEEGEEEEEEEEEEEHERRGRRRERDDD